MYGRILKEDLYYSGLLCREFRTACAHDTMALGALFAEAVLPRLSADSGIHHASQKRPFGFVSRLLPGAWRNTVSRPPVVRIGLHGNEGSGKTTFVHGMLDRLNDKTVIERPETDYKWQAVWHSATSGWIRHYDAACMLRHALPSYETNDLTKCGSPRTDIVEHPDDDHNRVFDHHLFLERDGAACSLFLFASPDLAGHAEFQDFIARSEPWHYNDGAQKPVLQ